MSDNLRLDAALAYKRMGFRVVLSKENSKQPLLQDWPNRDLTEEEIRTHFARNRLLNVGIALGNGLIRVDIDSTAGAELLDKMAGKKLPLTVSFRTPRGGYGFLFRLPSGDINENEVN